MSSVTVPTAGATVGVICGIAAAWVGAGALGLMAHPLRRVLMWILLTGGVLGVLPSARWTVWRRTSFVVGLVMGIAASAWSELAINVFAVPLVLAPLMRTQIDCNRRALRSALVATTVFALHRLFLVSAPSYWQLSNGMGGAIASSVGWAMGRPIKVGVSFGAVDFLVLMVSWYASWLAHTCTPRGRRGLYGALSIACAHILYLIVLSFVPAWVERFPDFNAATPDTFWLSVARHGVPWNVPALAAVVQLAVCLGMLRWASWNPSSEKTFGPLRRVPTWTRPILVAFAAAILVTSTTLYRGRQTLEGKTVVINKEGFLNWLKPEHGDYGRLSIGMYGLLSTFLESLGAQCRLTEDYGANDLKDADLLVLIYADEKWENGQVDRILDFVHKGGSLWVLGEHTVADEDDKTDAYNEVLQATGMEVLFDSSTFAVGGWLHSFEMLAHPALLGFRDDRNQLGMVIGATVRASPPARPVVSGRWGWSDWGDLGKPPSYMGNGRYDSGEILGDLVLAAEQDYGDGRIVVFGDTSSLSNGINIGANRFNACMFSYLANRLAGPSGWRDALAWGAGIMLLVFAFSWPTGANLPTLAVVIVATRILCTVATHRSMEIIPRTERMDDYELAYIDTSHNCRFSHESWRMDGTMGLMLNLMRNGYLTLTMPEFSAERLRHADLLVIIGPMRRYTKSECGTLRTFVEEGGVLIVTVSYPDREAALPLLDEFGFDFGGPAMKLPTTLADPVPMGFFKAPYFDTGDYRVYVRFDASWPVRCRYPDDNQPLAYGAGDEPVAICRALKKGKVVFIGDTGFAMNKNLEVESGEPFEGMRENPHFWRWLVTYLRDEPLWAPPDPNPPSEQAGGAEPETEDGAPAAGDKTVSDGTVPAPGGEGETP